MNSHFTVVYDACVLYPAPLRDFLMRLALTDLYRARWTDMIHDEWIRSILRQRPDLKPEDLNRTRALMNAHVRDSLITDFEHHLDERECGARLQDVALPRQEPDRQRVQWPAPPGDDAPKLIRVIPDRKATKPRQARGQTLPAQRL